MTPAPAPSDHRGEQLASVIHRAVQTIIARGLSDPRLESLITVTSVRVTDDRRTAVIMVSVMPERHESRVIHGLRDASRHIRRQAGDMVDIHRLPDLVFKLDHSAKKQAELLEAMARVRAEREAEPTGDTTPADPTQKRDDHEQG
jgi:ribosome-binding factor A